jgi:4-hydroxythreonine-4-phosphate dehydrogenase
MNIIFSIGDINGIGFEVLIKALNNNQHLFENNTFSIVANITIIQKLIINYNQLGYNNSGNRTCFIVDNSIIVGNNPKGNNSQNRIKIIDIISQKISPILKEIQNEESIIDFGKISKDIGTIAYLSFVEAINLVLKNPINNALVTLPISKKAITLEHPHFIGHTEELIEVCKAKNGFMILFDAQLRVALATIHIPISRVSKRITGKRLRNLIKNYDTTLKKDFRISNPKIAVLSLNPHSSDNGMFGNEEKDTILPAIKVMQRKGINVEGTFAADGFFASKKYIDYDGVIAMYHDQGLIPLKMLANGGGVNFTANLPIVRTSPDHGTAYEIAGKNIANSQSMVEAINGAIDILNNRIKT